MRGWLPILALGTCLAASTMPARADSTCVEVTGFGLGSTWQCESDKSRDNESLPSGSGTSVPRPNGPVSEVTPDGVTVVRGGYSNAPTVEEAADGVTVVRGPGQHH